MSTLDKDMNKFTRVESCVFIGFPSGVKGYKVLSIETNIISVTRNPIFHEHVFPFKDLHHSHSPDVMFPSTILPTSTHVSLDSFSEVHIHASFAHVHDSSSHASSYNATTNKTVARTT